MLCRLSLTSRFLHGTDHLHDAADPVLHLAIVEGHYQLSSNGFDSLLDPPATGTGHNSFVRHVCSWF